MKTKTLLNNKKFAFAYVLLVAVFFASCNETPSKEEEKGIKITTKASWGVDVYVKLIEIDSCEYLISTRNDAISLIHKQNCKYCASTRMADYQH